MFKHLRYIILVLGLFFILPGYASADSERENYKMAMSFEKTGDYAKAESLYVDLFTKDPNNFNYFNRYRAMLLLQRKHAELLPILEERLEKREYDKYLRLEIAVLHYALKNKKQAQKEWAEVFKGQKGNMKNSYANAIYHDALEYGVGNELNFIVEILRSITGDTRLLVKYNFPTSLRYRNWDQAVAEILHILDTNTDDLSVVRQYLFSYDPLSTLYMKTIKALDGRTQSASIELLTDIYIHLGEFATAYDLLSANIQDDNIRENMKKYAERMFKQKEYQLADRAASLFASFHDIEVPDKRSMTLLSARSKEMLFYEQGKEKEIVTTPYASLFLDIDFRPFDTKDKHLIRSAYAIFDSLSRHPDVIGEIASMRHADISYRVYQDFDAALNEYTGLTSQRHLIKKADIISNLSRLLLAKAEYDRSLTLLQTAAGEHGLMVHEEDQLLAYELYASVLSGSRDSLSERSDYVLAILPRNEVLYNDLLAFTSVVKQVLKDSTNYDRWLEAERSLLKNNTATAMDIYRALLEKKSEASHIYGSRYLDCIRAQKDQSAEGLFWERYYQDLQSGKMGDYFMLKYAEYMEKNQKFDIAYEIFEKYLLSYQESMYYENIREYVREHYSLGAP